MVIFDLIQMALNSASCTAYVPTVPSTWACACDVSAGIANHQGGVCPGSSFTAIAAAFATQGIWVQSNLVQQILTQGLGLWAPLLYILSAAGGLVSLALGAPPKMYLWFFMGPAIYDWLLDNTVAVHGVEWRIADRPQNQRDVWKLAEVGLRNSVPAGVTVSRDNRPTGFAQSPALFVWFDEVLSDVVQGMVGWTGVYDQVGAGTSVNSNLSGSPVGTENRWYLLSNLKWGLMEDITSAKLKSVELRDSFVTFLASECGENLKKSISSQQFIKMATAQGKDLGTNPSVLTNRALLTQLLHGQAVPTPRTMRKFLGDNSRGAFRGFNLFFNTGFINWWGIRDSMNCDGYLWLLIQAFRWEAGHQFFQLAKAAPGGVDPDNLVYTLLYGWDIRPPGSTSPIATPAQQRQYVINLILLHLFRNEMAIAPALVDQRFSSSQQAESISKGYQRAIGQKSKYAEVYTWAMMIPYLQGMLLYLLAVGYPIACMLVVMPGMHKVIFTWMSFWAWVKLWDVGFAFVLMIEKSLWAMLGNGSSAASLNSYIVDMSSFGTVSVGCNGGGATASGPLTTCSIPFVTNGSYSTSQTWQPAIDTFDRALALAANLDLDLQNSYYIYLMSALYFAVPTVTGQLVLGARAGSASMINSAIGGSAQEMGKSAGTAAQSEAITQMQANMGSVGQAAYTSAMRKSGLGQKAIELGNQGMREDMAASGIGAANSAAGRWREARNMENQGFRANVSAAQGIASGGQKLMGGGEVGQGSRQSTSTPGGPDPAPGTDNSGTGMAAGDTGGKSAAPLTPQQKAAGDNNAAFSSGMMSKVSGGAKAALGLAEKGAQIAAPMLEAAGAAGIAASSNAMYGDLVASQAMSADMDVAGFKAGGEAKGYNAHAGRVGEQAGFNAENAKWEAMSAYSSQITGAAAGVFGTFAGNFNPGPKPIGSANAMAAEGLLGKGAKDAVGFTDPGNKSGYRAALANTSGGISSAFGGDRVAGAYKSWTPTSAGAESMQNLAQAFTPGAFGGGRTGTQQVSSSSGTNGGRAASDSSGDKGAGTMPNGRSGAQFAPNPAASGSSVSGNIAGSAGAGQFKAPGAMK